MSWVPINLVYVNILVSLWSLPTQDRNGKDQRSSDCEKNLKSRRPMILNSHVMRGTREGTRSPHDGSEQR